jgi:hypothetical protein
MRSRYYGVPMQMVINYPGVLEKRTYDRELEARKLARALRLYVDLRPGGK